MENEKQQVDVVPVEDKTTEIATVTSEGNPDILLSVLEKKAALAPRFKVARDTILASQTYVKDWTEFGDNMCLSSAGAERVGTLFDITFSDCQTVKEEFTDALGSGYKYVTTITATMGNRASIGKGIYTSRDKFLCKKGDKYKALEDIPEANIEIAAYHIACGNAIKSLLGLRGIPTNEWENIMKNVGGDTAQKKGVNYADGSKGGTSKADAEKQNELNEICLEIAYMPATIEASEDYKSFTIATIPPDDVFDAVDLRDKICIELSSFIGKGDKKVNGKAAKDLNGKWLSSTLKRVKALVKGGK